MALDAETDEAEYAALPAGPPAADRFTGSAPCAAGLCPSYRVRHTALHNPPRRPLLTPRPPSSALFFRVRCSNARRTLSHSAFRRVSTRGVRREYAANDAYAYSQVGVPPTPIGLRRPRVQTVMTRLDPPAAGAEVMAPSVATLSARVEATTAGRGDPRSHADTVWRLPSRVAGRDAGQRHASIAAVGKGTVVICCSERETTAGGAGGAAGRRGGCAGGRQIGS